MLPCVVKCGCMLKVNGKGSIMVAPDKAIVSLGVTTENMQLEVAQRENAEKITSVINTLVALGIPKEAIQTQTYQIQPQYDFVDGRQVFRGYKVIHNLKIDVNNIGMVGKTVDSAVKAGANIVNSIDFTVSDPSRYYDAALNAALSDAIAKAASVGIKLRVNVSPIPVQIVEETYHAVAPVPLLSIQATGAATPIQPGQIEITALISAIFTYSC